MENKKLFKIAVILVAVAAGLTLVAGLMERSRNLKANTPTDDKEKTTTKTTTTKKVEKKDLVEGKKYITMDTKSYINFPSKGIFNKYSVTSNGGHTTSSGKYSINNKRITLEDLKLDAYYNEDYILIKDGLYEDNLFTMYYESTKNDKFIENLSEVIPDYIGDNVETNENLQELLNSIEVDIIDYCFKYSKDENEFSCSVNYKLYLKDYDYKNESYYDDFFAGSSPSYERLYIKRWTFLSFKPMDDEYKVTGAFTGL